MWVSAPITIIDISPLVRYQRKDHRRTCLSGGVATLLSGHAGNPGRRRATQPGQVSETGTYRVSPPPVPDQTAPGGRQQPSTGSPDTEVPISWSATLARRWVGSECQKGEIGTYRGQSRPYLPLVALPGSPTLPTKAKPAPRRGRCAATSSKPGTRLELVTPSLPFAVAHRHTQLKKPLVSSSF